MSSSKSFAKYVAEVKQDYHYVLKFAINEMTDVMIDQLESCLVKYNIKEASAFKKTPIQENPLDFPNIKNVPVFICNLTLGYPASLDFLRTYICNCLGLPPSQLAVYSSNDPRQIETDLFVDRSSPEYREKYKTTLGSDYEQVEGAEEEKYGEKYNMSFLKELEKVRKEREIVTVTNSLIPDQQIDHTTLTNNYDGFNDSKNLPTEDVGLFGRIKRANFRKAGVL